MKKFLLAGLFVSMFIVFATTVHLSKQETKSSTSAQATNIMQAPPPSNRTVTTTEKFSFPVKGSVSEVDILHSIPLDEIRKGCFQQDCIPSVDEPVFKTVKDMINVLEDDSLGIALDYKGEKRFYPFPMLETRELVNDYVEGDPLLISYCPLCGTGIVFDRTVNGSEVEFGVSGMLWQSNLLMYNRADDITDRNLWSQVLGEAVVGNKAGTKLSVVPSDIMQFSTWADANPEGLILSTGDPRDPYGGRYFDVASRFGPNFVASTSPLSPTVYVYGLNIDGQTKAYPRALLAEGVSMDNIGSTSITIVNNDGVVQFTDSNGELLPDVEGFWFSWFAAYPETELYQ